MDRRVIALLSICLFAGIVFAGCSNGSSGSSTTTAACTPVQTVSGTVCAETMGTSYTCQGTCSPGLVQTMVGSQIMCLPSTGCQACQGNYNGVCYQGVNTGNNYYNGGYSNGYYYGNTGYNWMGFGYGFGSYNGGFYPQVLPPNPGWNHHHHHHDADHDGD